MSAASPMPDRADVVVIAPAGATAICPVHAGLRVAMLDKAAIASQTSPRAAGLSGILRSDEIMTRIAANGVQRIEAFAAHTGKLMVFHSPAT